MRWAKHGRNEYSSNAGIRRSCAAARGADIAARCPCRAKRVGGRAEFFATELFRLSGPFHKYDHVRCAQFGLWQGARRAHTPPWVCNRRATQPQAKFGATRRAAVLFRPDFVARSLQIHCGICSPLAPSLAKKSLAAHVSIIKCHSTSPEAAASFRPGSFPDSQIAANHLPSEA